VSFCVFLSSDDIHFFGAAHLSDVEDIPGYRKNSKQCVAFVCILHHIELNFDDVASQVRNVSAEQKLRMLACVWLLGGAHGQIIHCVAGIDERTSDLALVGIIRAVCLRQFAMDSDGMLEGQASQDSYAWVGYTYFWRN
jgi:hypothetical protein